MRNLLFGIACALLLLTLAFLIGREQWVYKPQFSIERVWTTFFLSSFSVDVFSAIFPLLSGVGLSVGFDYKKAAQESAAL